MNRLALRFALVVTGLAHRLLPAAQRDWGSAMLGEVLMIDRGAEALRFALGCLGHAALARAGESPLLLGGLCAALATVLGLAFMALAGAPPRYLAINGAALIIGLLALANLRLLMRLVPVVRAGLVALGLALLFALLTVQGTAAQGALRWVQVGGAMIQPSFILIPLLVCVAARERTTLALAGLAIAAAILALQPDRAMATALALAVTGLWWNDRECGRTQAALIAWLGVAATFVRPDLGERMPYVDQILWLAFGVHPLAGVAVWGGSLLLVTPALVLWQVRPDLRTGLLAHALVWSGTVLAAALGNYPTPLVGYGSSAVIGYCLSLLALIPPGTSRASQDRFGFGEPELPDRDRPLRMALR